MHIHTLSAAIVEAAAQVNAAGEGFAEPDALVRRQQSLGEIDRRGILATPANSFINELVIEAARLSILQDGHPASIEYQPFPAVWLRGQ